MTFHAFAIWCSRSALKFPLVDISPSIIGRYWRERERDIGRERERATGCSMQKLQTSILLIQAAEHSHRSRLSSSSQRKSRHTGSWPAARCPATQCAWSGSTGSDPSPVPPYNPRIPVGSLALGKKQKKAVELISLLLSTSPSPSHNTALHTATHTTLPHAHCHSLPLPPP